MKKLLKLYRSSSPAFRTSLWFAVCNYLQRGTALIVVPIFTKLLTTEQYGLCMYWHLTHCEGRSPKQKLRTTHFH